MLFPTFQRFQNKEAGGSLPLPPVSPQAQDLMKDLITRKEFRIGGRKYQDHELKQQRPAGKRTAVHPHVHANFVFENDVAEIKKHAWFRGFRWDRVHEMTPPFVPHILHNQPLTKYFQDERSIAESSNDGYTTPFHIADYINVETPLDVAETLSQLQSARASHLVHENEKRRALKWLADKNPEVLKTLNLDVKKRPRDKILRDAVAGRVAMKIRKQKGFPGYEYRRPYG
jgi:protein-serine/threonine kinase